MTLETGQNECPTIEDLNFWVCKQDTSPNSLETFDCSNDQLWEAALDNYPIILEEMFLVQTDTLRDGKRKTTMRYPTPVSNLFYELSYINSQENIELNRLSSRKLVMIGPDTNS